RPCDVFRRSELETVLRSRWKAADVSRMDRSTGESDAQHHLLQSCPENRWQRESGKFDRTLHDARHESLSRGCRSGYVRSGEGDGAVGGAGEEARPDCGVSPDEWPRRQDTSLVPLSSGCEV